jgi:Ras-related protein Rab-23
MLDEEVEIALKVLIVGNGGIGKSSMIQRYCKNIFTKEYKVWVCLCRRQRQR